MKLKEFYSIDLAEKAYYEMHQMLESAKLLENNINYRNYVDFINSEKTYTIDISNLNVGGEYYPLYLNSVPTAEFIKGEYLEDLGKFIKIDNKRAIFDTQKGVDIKFPIDRDMGDGKIDLFVFDSKQNLNHFLSVIHLKFAGWTIKINPVSI